MSSISFRDMAQMLAMQATTVAEHLLGTAGKRIGNDLCYGDICGGSGQSLRICVSGGKAGVWADFAATGHSGDLIDLWRISRGLTAAETAKEVKDYLGIKDENPFAGRRKKEYSRPSRPAAKRVASNDAAATYLRGRGLTDEVIASYRVAYLQNLPDKFKAEQQDWLVFPFMRDSELVALKYLCLHRPDGKKIIRAEGGCEPILFGWQAIPDDARTVTICEGEVDAMSLAVYGHPALSVPNGGGGGNKQQWLDSEWHNLERFDEIYLCLDGDTEGQAAVVEICSRLGAHRCRIVELPYKDANECLQRGVTAEQIATCYEQAQTNDPEELLPVSAFTADIVEYFHPAAGTRPGFDLPWRKTGPMRIHHGELSIWTGYNGHGKSVLLGQVMMAAAQQGERVCIASLEMRPHVTFGRMMRQAAGSSRPSEGTILRIVDDWRDQFWVFNLVGTGKVDRVLAVFEYAYRRYGVRQFVVDSLMKLGMGDQDYDGQKLTVERMADFCNEFSVCVHLVAHARKQADEMSPPNKMDIKGTGSITDQADNVFCVFRNKQKELDIQEHLRENGGVRGSVFDELNQRYDAMLICDKYREDGEKEGRWGLFFDRQTLVYTDSQPQQQFVAADSDDGLLPEGWVA